MARWHELLKFKCCMIISVREIRHSVSEIVGPFEIPWSTESCVYQEYLMEVQRLAKVFNDHPKTYLARLIFDKRHDTDSNQIPIQCKKYQTYIQQVNSKSFSLFTHRLLSSSILFSYVMSWSVWIFHVPAAVSSSGYRESFPSWGCVLLFPWPFVLSSNWLMSWLISPVEL